MGKQKLFPVAISVVAVFLLNGCTVLEGIFKAGMWWAFFLVAVVVVFILWIIAKARKK